MRVMLGFHYRGDIYREPLFKNKVEPEMVAMYPWAHVSVSDSGHEPYNRAASRNALVQEAIDGDYDILVICDADSICTPQVLQQAIDSAVDGKVHIPFDVVRVLSARAALDPDKIYRWVPELYTYGPSFGGIFVFQPKRWVEAGGMDERIIGWGYEDQIFLVAVRAFLGRPVHHTGVLYNFQHPRVSFEDDRVLNMRLRDKYNYNINQKDEIRRLQRGSNRWMT